MSKVRASTSQGTRSDAHNLDDLRMRWAARFEEAPSLRIEKGPAKHRESVSDFKAWVSQASYDDLLFIRDEVVARHEEAKLRHATINLSIANGGQYLDKREHRARKQYKIDMGLRISIVNNAISKLPRAVKDGKRIALLQAFVDIFEEENEQGEFLRILNAARKRVEHACTKSP